MWRLQKKAEAAVELRVNPGEENRENRLFAATGMRMPILKGHNNLHKD